MSRVLYLGQAIDRVTPSAAADIEDTVSDVALVASMRGWLVYSPRRAWAIDVAAAPGPEVEAVNRAALEGAGAFIGVSLETTSVGLWRELEMARSLGVPSAIVGANPSWSLADTPLLHTPDDIIAWLEEVGPPAPSPMITDVPMPIAFAQAGDEYLGALPSRKYRGDAGYDLYTAQSVEIPPGEFRDIPCGVRCALPPNVWGRITGRSSTLRNRGLLVIEGVIASGYRGPLFAGVYNLGSEPVTVAAGERIAQMLLHINVARVHDPVWVHAADFEGIPHDGRASAGFGSTGT